MSAEVKKHYLTTDDIRRRVAAHPDLLRMARAHEYFNIWGVPRGGVPVAMTAAVVHGFTLVDDPEQADIIIDDLEDSGATRTKYTQLYPNAVFVPLFVKKEWWDGQWVIFPWEESEERDELDHMIRVLEHSGIPTTEQELDKLKQYLVERAREVKHAES